jgi:RNA polymerase-binding transcription factor DksA
VPYGRDRPAGDEPLTRAVVDLPAARAALLAARASARARLTELTGTFDELVEASAGSNADDEHDPEGATIAFERSQLGAVVRQVREQVDETDAALDRLDAGAYGVCEVCGEQIPVDRLAARPVARRCLTCAGLR